MKRTEYIKSVIREQYATHPNPQQLANELGIADNLMRKYAGVMGIRRENRKYVGRNPEVVRREQIIREKYPICESVEALAEELGMCLNSLRGMAGVLGLRRVVRKKTDKGVRLEMLKQAIGEKYPTCTDKEALAKELGITKAHLINIASLIRVKCANKAKPEVINRKKVKATPELDALIKAEYANLTQKQLAEKSGVTQRMIKRRVKELGLVKQKPQQTREERLAKRREYDRERYHAEPSKQRTRVSERQKKARKAKERELSKVERQWQQQRAANARKEERRVLKSKPLDLTGKILVRIDSRTQVYALPGQSKEELLIKYGRKQVAA